MEDNKLTEFEPSEFEKIILDLINKNTWTNGEYEFNDTEFISDLRQIMPPTCKPNERKFLDEIRSKGRFVKNDDLKLACIEIRCENGNVFLHQSDFPKSNLSELVEKKE